jgi:protein-disulfide isomerase
MTFAGLIAALIVAVGCGSSERSRNALAGSSDGVTQATPDEALLARADSSRIQGADTAPLWVIEVSDYQCPYCRIWHEATYEQFRREFVETGRVRFAYLHFPLSHHPNAWPAAEAAMCAGAQGRFWEIHDGIFATQERWAPLSNPRAHFDSLANAAGVAMPAFRSCVANRTMRALVQGDFDRSREAGVNSTPTFVIGNTAVSGALPIDAFRELIAGAEAQPR